MSTSLSVPEAMPTSVAQWQMLREQATVLVKSGFLPQAINTPEKAMAVMLTGRELGVPPMFALRNIVIIQGRPTCQATLMAALVYRDHGDDALEVVESDEVHCLVRYKRRGWTQRRTYAFTIEDAQRAGLLVKQTWQQYPAAMLRARTLSAVCTMAFQDSIAGMYTPEELGADVDVADDGEIMVSRMPTVEVLDAATNGHAQLPAPVATRKGECQRCHADSEITDARVCADEDGCRARCSAIKRTVSQPDPEPPPMDDDLSAELDAHFAEHSPIKPKRFTGTVNEKAVAFQAMCEDKLSLDLGAIQRELGGPVKDYMRATGRDFDGVYEALAALVEDGLTVPGKLGAEVMA